jgi:hypothetical protein
VFARVARFENVDPSTVDAQLEEMNSQGPPPGLEHAKGYMQLLDRGNGTVLGIVLFEDEDGMRRGDEALNAMTPPAGTGNRANVEMYEVVAEMTND